MNGNNGGSAANGICAQSQQHSSVLPIVGGSSGSNISSNVNGRDEMLLKFGGGGGVGANVVGGHRPLNGYHVGGGGTSPPLFFAGSHVSPPIRKEAEKV